MAKVYYIVKDIVKNGPWEPSLAALLPRVARPKDAIFSLISFVSILLAATVPEQGWQHSCIVLPGNKLYFSPKTI